MDYCYHCGMQVRAGEYHPFAACLMFKGCGDREVVQANLKSVTEQWKGIGERKYQKDAARYQYIKNNQYGLRFGQLFGDGECYAVVGTRLPYIADFQSKDMLDFYIDKAMEDSI